MGGATVVGAEGSGRSVFVALLYASLVRYGGEAADHFRFHALGESLDVLGAMYTDLRSGEVPRWPPGAPSTAPVTLLFSNRTSEGRFAHLLHTASPPTERTLDLQLQRAGTPELEQFVATEGALTPLGLSLLEGGFLVVTLDSSLLVGDKGGGHLTPHPWDSNFAALLSALQRAAADHPGSRPRRSTPILVLTKFDRIAQAVRAELLPEGATMDGWTAPVRAQTTRTLLERFLPASRAKLTEAGPSGFRFGSPSTFISWVLPEDPSSPTSRLKGHTTPSRGWEPDYPFLEYRDLIERLGTPS